VSVAAGLGAVPLWLAAAVVAGPRPQTPRIVVDVRGPVALVEVTRTLPAPDGTGAHLTERLLDLALPDGAALVDVAVEEAGRWRPAEAAHDANDERRARDVYLARLGALALVPAREPFDDDTTVRLRVVSAARADARVDVRYRFTVLPSHADGRSRVRFPASPERMPVSADVVVKARDVAEVEIAGVRIGVGAGHVTATGHANAHGAWELSWAPRAVPPRATIALVGRAATARLSPRETAVAVSARAVGHAPQALPPSVLLVIDRSRSVGLPGLADERDLARKLLEALPPATRFDALFFDRGVARLFAASRPATREAMGALDTALVPDRLRNGTDLRAALHEASALLGREASAFGPRVLLALITDGALPEGPDAAALDHALGGVAGVEVTVAAWTIRARDDEAPPATATRALRGLATGRGGAFREAREGELDETLAAMLDALARGGDLADVRLRAGGDDRAIAGQLAPGEERAGLLTLANAGPLSLAATTRGARVSATLHAEPIDGAWLRPLVGGDAARTRLLATDATLALVEPVVRAAPAAEVPVKGSLDRVVVRNTLSLAFTPRARACYLDRSGATAASRDLTGRVRLAIDLARGEVGDVVVRSSTLARPDIEACLRDGAFAIDVPRALRSDFPVTAILNLVFRPRTPEKSERPEEAALGEQIDLIIEELHDELRRTEAPASSEPPALDRSVIPTR
jgi:hypothetical protein